MKYKCDFISLLYNSLDSRIISNEPNKTFSTTPVKRLTSSIHSKRINKYSLQRKKFIRSRDKK